MVTMIMDGDNTLDHVELDFFLKGNTSLDTIEAKKPYKWMSDNGWKDMQKLDIINPTWEGFIESINDNAAAWKDFYDQEAPEQCPIPGGYSKKLSKFQ
jgi:dynein heavy chain